jgi:hypothetical protein
MATQLVLPKGFDRVFRQWPLRFTLAFLSIGIGTLFISFEVRAQGLQFQIKEATEIRSSGQVNWTTGTISVSGIGIAPPDAPAAAAQAMAYRAARVVASRNLLEMVEGIRVDSETIVENYLVTSDTIKEQVSGFVRTARVLKHQNFPDGSVEVFLAMPLWGKNSLTSALLMDQAMSRKDLTERNSDEGYTGMMIDTRGLGVQPATFPAVLDQEGKLVYGPLVVSRQAAEQHGLVQYYIAGSEKDLSLQWGHAFLVTQKDKARSFSRAGRRPLQIKGLKRRGTLHANIIISAADAEKIRGNPQLMRALRAAKVVIITDPLVAGIE